MTDSLLPSRCGDDSVPISSPHVFPELLTSDDVPVRIYDPGGPTVLDYCTSYHVVDEAILEFSTIVTSPPVSCGKDCDFLQRRALALGLLGRH